MATKKQSSLTWKGQFLPMLFGITFSLLLAELGARVLYTGQAFSLEDIEEWNPMDDSQFVPKLNELRFREDPYSDAIFGENYTRVLFLGDSFTFGQGIPDGDARFSDILEKELAIRLNKQVHVYNASRPGTEPKHWVEFYKQVQPVYKPAHVFAIFFLRDGTDLCTSFRCYESILSEIQSQYSERFLYKYSYLGKFFYNRRIQNEFSEFYAGQIREAYLGDAVQTEVWHSQQEALIQLQEMSLADGSSFELIIFPILYRLDDNYPFYDVEETIIDFADLAGISVFSLTPGFIGQSAEDLWVSVSDQHPNKQGHLLAAETLLPYMMQILSK